MRKENLTLENLVKYFRPRVNMSDYEWDNINQKEKMRESTDAASNIVSKKEDTSSMTIKEILIRGYMYCENEKVCELESPCLTDEEYEELKNASKEDIENLYYFIKRKMPTSLLRESASEFKAVLNFAKNSNSIRIKQD